MGLTDDWRQVLSDATALARMKRDLKDRAEEILRSAVDTFTKLNKEFQDHVSDK